LRLSAIALLGGGLARARAQIVRLHGHRPKYMI
jgi:hypothetical protein